MSVLEGPGPNGTLAPIVRLRNSFRQVRHVTTTIFALSNGKACHAPVIERLARHRRAGTTVATINDLIFRALRDNKLDGAMRSWLVLLTDCLCSCPNCNSSHCQRGKNRGKSESIRAAFNGSKCTSGQTPPPRVPYRARDRAAHEGGWG